MFSSSEKRGILAAAIVSGKFEDDRKKKCIDLGKQIANKQISNEDIINQVAELASRYIVWMDPINNPENGNLVKAIANGDSQFVIEYLKKHRDSRNRDIHLSQISDIFLTMMSDDELNEYAARNIIFVKLLELFGGYFIIGADLVLKPDNVLLVEDFVNIGTFYDSHEKYPNDIDIQSYRYGRTHSCSLNFVFSKFGNNLKYDKFTPSEFRKATKYPFPEKLRLQFELSKCAQDKIRIVDMADAADIEKRQSAREASAASAAASEAARKAAQDEREAKVEAARAAFEASGNASQSVIGANTISAKGGRRTRHKRSDKRSGNKRTKRSGKRSGNKRSNKRSGHKSGRR
jgi:hypothetical protein